MPFDAERRSRSALSPRITDNLQSQTLGDSWKRPSQSCVMAHGARCRAELDYRHLSQNVAHVKLSIDPIAGIWAISWENDGRKSGFFRILRTTNALHNGDLHETLRESTRYADSGPSPAATPVPRRATVCRAVSRWHDTGPRSAGEIVNLCPVADFTTTPLTGRPITRQERVVRLP